MDMVHEPTSRGAMYVDQNVCKGEVTLSIQLCPNESCVVVKLKYWRERA